MKADLLRRLLFGAFGLVGLALLAGCDAGPTVLRGQVTLEGSGAPAAGLVVTAYADDSETAVASTTVGGDGVFRFAESVLDPGPYRLRLGDHGWWPDAGSWAEATPVMASADAPGSITATVSSAWLTGQVTADGAPVAGADVQVLVAGRASDVATSAVTDAEGRYHVTVSHGSFVVKVQAPGRATTYSGDATAFSRAEVVEVGVGGTAVADVELPAAASLGAQLVDSGPVSGALVVAVLPDVIDIVGTATTDELGRFDIGALHEGEYRLLIVRSGYPLVFLPGTYHTGQLGTIVLPGLVCTHPLAQPGADLRNRILVGADLSGCDLTGALLQGANLRDARLTGATLAGARLDYATTLRGVRSGGIVGTPAELASDVRLIGGYLIADGVDLTGATLVGSFDGARLAGAVLTDADLSDANLFGIRSGGITTVPAALPTDWTVETGYLVGPGANLGAVSMLGVDWSGRNLAGINLGGADMRGSDFSGSNLAGANFQSAALDGSDLSGADLSGAVLTNTRLTDTVLTGATVTGARLYTSSLSGVISGGLVGVPLEMQPSWRLIGGYLVGSRANLTGAVVVGSFDGATLNQANLTGADLSGADLSGVRSGGITTVPAALPTHWGIVDGYLVGPGADLFGITQLGIDLSGRNLAGIDLGGADIRGSDFSGSNLSGANFQSAALDGSDLSGADLSGAVLTNTRLTDTVLTGATVTGARLYTSSLSGVISGGLVGVPLEMQPSWRLIGGYLVGSRANLTGAVVVGSFDGATLNQANLTGADLSGADLAGVSSGGITTVPAALPSGWTLESGYLVGSRASLVNANLAGADLSGRNLSGANLRGASLADADLAGTDLSGATLESTVLDRADLTGAILTGARIQSARFLNATLTGVISGGLIGSPTGLPAGWSVVGGTLVYSG